MLSDRLPLSERARLVPWEQQRGFVLSALLGPIMPYALIAVGVAMLGLAVTAKVQTVRLHHTQSALSMKTAELDNFKAQVQVLGDAAAKTAAAKTKQDKLDKEKTDAQIARNIAALNADIVKLRHDRDSARGSAVPAAPAGSSRPDLACFDRALIESATGELLAELRGQADKGAKATVELNGAKRWAQP